MALLLESRYFVCEKRSLISSQLLPVTAVEPAKVRGGRQNRDP